MPLLAGAFDALVPTEPLAALGPALRDADVGVDLHGRGPASQRILVAGGARRLIAFANDAVPETAGGATWRTDEHEVVRWCRMLDEAGVPADAGDLDLPRPAEPSLAPGATVLHVGAASASRRWPAARFASVAAALRANGDRVVVTGGPDDVAAAHATARAAGLHPSAVLAGRTGLLALATLVAEARRVVAGDTGVAHLATAFRTPSVLLFGPVAPAAWGPPPRPIHRVLWAGRLGDPHGATLDPGLAEIAPADVLAALGALPERATTRV